MNLNISNWGSKCLLYLIVLFSWQRYWGRYIGFIRNRLLHWGQPDFVAANVCTFETPGGCFWRRAQETSAESAASIEPNRLVGALAKVQVFYFLFFPVSVSVRCMLMMYCMPFESNWSMESSNILEPHKSLRWESYFEDTFKIREFTSCSYYTRLETASAKMHAMAWHMPRNVWSQSKCWRRLKFLGSDKSSSSCFRDNHWHMKEMRGKVSTVATRSLLISLWWTWCWKPSGHASQGDGRIQS